MKYICFIGEENVGQIKQTVSFQTWTGGPECSPLICMPLIIHSSKEQPKRRHKATFSVYTFLFLCTQNLFSNFRNYENHPWSLNAGPQVSAMT